MTPRVTAAQARRLDARYAHYTADDHDAARYAHKVAQIPHVPGGPRRRYHEAMARYHDDRNYAMEVAR